jgi:hypothetical protein
MERGVFVEHTLTRPAAPAGLLCASPQRGREFYPIVHHVRVLTVTYCLP